MFAIVAVDFNFVIIADIFFVVFLFLLLLLLLFVADVVVLVGASQAFYNPAAYTLISDIFPKNMVVVVVFF